MKIAVQDSSTEGRKYFKRDLSTISQNLTRGGRLGPLLYADCDRMVVNRAEPWIQNHYLGELCPQDIKDAKPPPAPQGTVEAREFFRQRIKRSQVNEKTLFPNEASNHQLGGQFTIVASFVFGRARKSGLSCDLPAEWFAQNTSAVVRKNHAPMRQTSLAASIDVAGGFGT